MVAKRCPCGCNRLAPCARGLAMIAQAEARKKAEVGRRWSDHHERKPINSGWYHTTRWRKRRAEQLAREPWCFCGEKATDADHVHEPAEGDERAFFEGELRSYCKRHHMAKHGRK